MAVVKNILYQDLNGNDPKSSPTVINAMAVFQSITNILRTRTGERFFNPNFGLDLEDEIFEIIDDLGAFSLRTKTLSAIEKFERKVIIDNQGTEFIASPDDNLYEVDIRFSIVGLEEGEFQYIASISR